MKLYLADQFSVAQISDLTTPFVSRLAVTELMQTKIGSDWKLGYQNTFWGFHRKYQISLVSSTRVGLK
jgi:hypothetical protein